MTQAIMQAAIEVMKTAVEAMSEVKGPAKRNNTAVATPSVSTTDSGPVLKQPAFNWKAQGKYNELLNFEMEVKYKFLIESYGTWETDSQ